MSVTDVLAPAGGVLFVAFALRDVFHTLFHPGGHGGLAGALCRGTWWLADRMGERPRSLAGPSAVVLTITVWLGLLVLGFALALLPLVPQDLTYAKGSPQGPAFLDALYLSGISVSTLGLGDVAVQEPALRWLAPAEALLGFGVITAAITWITQLYPALSRRRSLALDVWCALEGAREDDHPDRLDDVDDAVVRGWAARVAEVEVDLVQNTETFWFRESDPRLALAPCLERLAAVARGRADTSTGRHLARALASLDRTLGVQYPGDPAR